ncbi:MAG TPA: hypothetical protein VGA51_17725, partial [Casimicrobiaceae bacterium]
MDARFAPGRSDGRLGPRPRNRRRRPPQENRGGIAMAYFVTGGTGFIGRFLVGNLLKRGDPV